MRLKPSFRLATVSLVAMSALSAAPAQAKGCNGVVDQLRWGCAAWDNNNGPQYPHYSGNHSSGGGASANVPANNPPPAVNRNGNGIISNDGGSIVTNTSANMRNH